MIEGLSISVVIPTKNEVHGLKATLQKIPTTVDQILVIDANSQDGTQEIAQAHPHCKLIVEPRKGYGRAYKTAFENITTDLVATADADGTYATEKLPEIVKFLKENSLDFINCSRFPLVEPGAMFYKNFMGNAGITLMFNLIFGSTLTDSLTGMWVFRSKIIPTLILESDGWNFSEEIKYEAIRTGHKFQEYHTAYRERVGESKMSPWKTGLDNLLYLFQLYFKRGHLKKQYELLRDRRSSK